MIKQQNNLKMNTTTSLNRANCVLVCAFCAAIFCANPLSAAQTTLSGIDIFSADSSGNASGGDIWNARGNDGPVDVYVTDGSPLTGAFLNGPTDSSATISLALTTGTYTYGLVTTGGLTTHVYHGFSLFFNGSLTPNISVFAADRTSPNGAAPTFYPDASQYTYDLTGGNPPMTPAANSASFQSGDLLITLTDFSWAGPSVYNLDRVSGVNSPKAMVGQDGIPDWVGQFTLSVVQVPEPASGALLLMSFVGMMFFVRCGHRGKQA
jgi:hypothetical protein